MTACKHTFTACDVPQYERCSICGTYHSLGALAPKEIYDKDYWSDKWGHGSIRDQHYNVAHHLENGISKNEFVMKLIHPPNGDAVLEIACSPGDLLGRLTSLFPVVLGIEVDQAYEKAIMEMAGKDVDLMFGYFPEVTLLEPKEIFSLIVGLDILEHSHEPEAFLAECYRLLKPGGQLILMLPLTGGRVRPPDRFFHPIEHVYIHSVDNIHKLLEDAGFTQTILHSWTPGHETITAIRI